jgi:type IV pilus assembly protein PilV
MNVDLESPARRDSRATVPSPNGFTLIEVLIALLVLSIGLVGLAVLTIQSLQNTHSSLYTSLASAAALDFEERLWLDLGRRASGCPDPNTNFPNNFVTNWTAAGANLGLPVFAFNATTDTTALSIRRIVFTLSWDESRFAGGNTDAFVYETRVVCRG